MKIGLLTVPFNNNYGGLLQAFALKYYLESNGHNVTIINRRRDWENNKLKIFVKGLLKYLHCNIADKSIHTNRFIKEHLSPITKRIYTNKELTKYNDSFDFYIVGSDQVWRYNYAPTNICNYFFDFLEATQKPRISYAASFGVSFNEYDESTIKRVRDLLLKFKAISVREDSAIKLLTNTFSIESDIIHVLDPTMLIEKNVYINIAKKYPIYNNNRYIFSYILDKTEDKKKLINIISENEKASVININAQTGKNRTTIEPVEKWLSCIINSSYVVTDSFHGMVFSIIFNKPFVAYVNKDRGAERFESLLSLLNINGCLISDSRLYKKSNLDWEEINKVLEMKRQESKYFLDTCLLE